MLLVRELRSVIAFHRAHPARGGVIEAKDEIDFIVVTRLDDEQTTTTRVSVLHPFDVHAFQTGLQDLTMHIADRMLA